MRALVLHGPGRFSVEPDWPDPQPESGWARIRVTRAGICGSDLPRFITTGSYHHPIILGHEFAGIVDEPAPGSEAFRGGESVAVLPLIPCGDCPGCARAEPFHCERYQFLGSRNDGGFAQYCLVPEENLFPLPETFDVRWGAFLEPLAVTLNVVRRSGFVAGQRVLVFGAGTIGLLTGLWLRVFGAAQVVMADVRGASLEIAWHVGFEDVVDPEDARFASMAPFDAAFEAAGAVPALLSAIDRTRDKGTITVVGRDTNDTVIPVTMFEMLMRKEITVRGCWGYNMLGEHAFVREMLRQERFPLEPLITHEVGLGEAPGLIRAMAERRVFYCKVLIDPWR